MTGEVVSLGERLRQRRQERGLSQAQAARELDVARTAYRLWEMEAAKPAPDRWRLISRWLGISVAAMLLADELIDEDEAAEAGAIAERVGGSPPGWDDLGARGSGDFFTQERATIADQTREGNLSPAESSHLNDVLGRVEGMSTLTDAPAWASAELRKVLPSVAESAAVARAAIVVTAAGTAPDILADAELLTNELVANAVVHSGSDVLILGVQLGQQVLRVEVEDRGSSHIRPRGGDTGWGLTFVAELADRWGVSRGDGRNVAWFELDLERHSRN